MMFDEFKDRVRDRGVPCDISYSDYRLIELVYMWHPCIKGKDTIVDLWLIGGIKLMEELRPRAERVKERSTAIERKTAEIRRLQKELRKMEMENQDE